MNDGMGNSVNFVVIHVFIVDGDERGRDRRQRHTLPKKGGRKALLISCPFSASKMRVLFLAVRRFVMQLLESFDGECDRKHFGQSYGRTSLSVAAAMI